MSFIYDTALLSVISQSHCNTLYKMASKVEREGSRENVIERWHIDLNINARSFHDWTIPNYQCVSNEPLVFINP